MFIREAVCFGCEHYIGVSRCKAFLTGIPKSILSGENRHQVKVPGDGGLRYKARRGAVSSNTAE